MADEHVGGTPGGAPRVDELFQQAVAAQLSVQQAQRDSYTEFARRLEVAERLMTDGLGAIVKTLRANDGALEHFGERLAGMEEAVSTPPPAPAVAAGAAYDAERIEMLEKVVLDRLESVDATDGLDSMGRRLTALEGLLDNRLRSLHEMFVARFDTLAEDIRAALGSHDEALEDARVSREVLQSRLGVLEESVRSFETQTTEQLAELREASTAAEAGILERIILESQTVASHFETVRPAVEAAVQAGPELESTLNELRELAERAIAAEAEAADSSPYSAEELLAPHDDEHEDDPLFQPPEETKIPERRFLRRDR